MKICIFKFSNLLSLSRYSQDKRVAKTERQGLSGGTEGTILPSFSRSGAVSSEHHDLHLLILICPVEIGDPGVVAWAQVLR